MTCPGSVALSEGIEDTGSSAASEGTMMHTVAAHCLLANADAAKYIGVTDTETGLTLNDDQARAVQTYVDYVRKRVAETQRHPAGRAARLHRAHDRRVGRPRHRRRGHHRREELIVLDAKFGRGVEVEAEENPQLLMYAHAVFKEWDLIHDFTKVTVGIVQPRLGASPGVVPEP
jgi:hypothetical protein